MTFPSVQKIAKYVILNQLKIKSEHLSLLPQAIHHLNPGGLVIIDKCMLPFVRAVVEKVRSLVNEDSRCKLGHCMIQVAKTDIEGDASLFSVFMDCKTMWCRLLPIA